MNVRNEKLETKCKELEEAKFNFEKKLLDTQDANQKIELRRDEADTEVKRLSVSVEKVWQKFH